MKNRKGIVWFRQDLRIHDNTALTDALKNCDEILPVFVFDERTFTGKTKFGFPKTGSIRAQFIIESDGFFKILFHLLTNMTRSDICLNVRVKIFQDIFNAS